MLKRLGFRRFAGALAVILGVAALTIVADPPPPGACVTEDANWVTADG
jgi:hypothetical protein